MRSLVTATLITLVTLSSAAAQPAAGPAATPKSSAAIDLTGYLVAFVTEDWRFRMITPRKGDYQAVPMT